MAMSRTNYRNAAAEMMDLAIAHGLPDLPPSSTPAADYPHLSYMRGEIERNAKHSLAKLGRWLGWIQCAVYIRSGGALDLGDIKAVSMRNSHDADPQTDLEAYVFHLVDRAERAERRAEEAERALQNSMETREIEPSAIAYDMALNAAKEVFEEAMTDDHAELYARLVTARILEAALPSAMLDRDQIARLAKCPTLPIP